MNLTFRIRIRVDGALLYCVTQQRKRRSSIATEQHEQNTTLHFGQTNPELQPESWKLNGKSFFKHSLGDYWDGKMTSTGYKQNETKTRTRQWYHNDSTRSRPLNKVKALFGRASTWMDDQIRIPRVVITSSYDMASSASGQDDPNRAMWLATRAGKMEPSCPLGTTRCIPQEKFPKAI